jgi:dienelactone hydrolase
MKKYLILIACLAATYGLNAQTSSEIYDKPLSDVLNDIQTKYQVTLKYSNDRVKDKIVTNAVWKMHLWDVEATLTNILYPLDFRFNKDGEKTYSIVHFRYHVKPEAEGAANLKALLELYPTLGQWEARKVVVRENILQQIGLSPFPKKTPLNPKIVNKRKYDGYTVENVSLEVLPVVFLCGSLYQPAKKGKYPAMLCPHGHFEKGRYRPEHQYRCAMLARMGVIAFSYDTFACNEGTLQVSGEAHSTALALTMQTWNSIRVVDFLTSLSDVDAARIGITGASGGGTQSFLAAALDRRITLSVPAVMVSSHFYGGCPCESGLPIHHLTNAMSTNNVEIAALFAPLPQLLISDGGDWTCNNPTVEFPYLQAIYSLYGKKDFIENVHLANEVHDYGPSKRFAMYHFVAKHFNLDIKKIQDKAGKFDESKVTIEPAEKMFAFGTQQKLPDNAVLGADNIRKALLDLQTK